MAEQAAGEVAHLDETPGTWPGRASSLVARMLSLVCPDLAPCRPHRGPTLRRSFPEREDGATEHAPHRTKGRARHRRRPDAGRSDAAQRVRGLATEAAVTRLLFRNPPWVGCRRGTSSSVALPTRPLHGAGARCGTSLSLKLRSCVTARPRSGSSTPTAIHTSGVSLQRAPVPSRLHGRRCTMMGEWRTATPRGHPLDPRPRRRGPRMASSRGAGFGSPTTPTG